MLKERRDELSEREREREREYEREREAKHSLRSIQIAFMRRKRPIDIQADL